MISDYQARIVALLVLLFAIFLATFGTLLTVPIIILLAIVLSTFATSFYGSSYLPSKKRAIEAIIKEIHLKKNDVVYDIGSGDGRFVIAMAKRTQAKVIGLEIDLIKWLISSISVRMKGLRNAKIIRESFFSYDYSDASIVFIYLPQPTVDKLQTKLKKLRKGTIVIANRIQCKELRLMKEIRKEKIRIYKI
ncbi:MAG: hypothetical protein HY517_02980 [Candidatus Aenigmarchaeota archaeon]|nr:hypothetical protein [Candidatus Aenigmarchaeota archaeon]